ncbi:Translocase of chloroplast, chloroplastic [Sesamum angolense]|uniref:Translocase of chloroplast, chloroplastic n=1 Tax=Sesamum angolense TaxID=2727404 RepID=A0AAE1X8X6_9LAMI|nr:Translocase of chloroplast, chloroplastic [Sesamum angolense]
MNFGRSGAVTAKELVAGSADLTNDSGEKQSDCGAEVVPEMVSPGTQRLCQCFGSLAIGVGCLQSEIANWACLCAVQRVMLFRHIKPQEVLLLQSRAHQKLPSDQGSENVDSDIDLDDLSDSDQVEEDEYDQLPLFRPLNETQLAKLSREQRKASFEEYDYRVKLLQKEQWREELRRWREIKKKGKDVATDYGFTEDDADSGAAAPVAVLMNFIQLRRRLYHVMRILFFWPRKVGYHVDDEVEDPLFNDGDETNLYARIASATHTLSNERIVYLPTVASVSDSDEEIFSDDERHILRNLDDDDDLPEALDTGVPCCSDDEENPQSLKSMIPRRTMVDQFHEAFGTVSAVDERPHLAFLDHSGSGIKLIVCSCTPVGEGKEHNDFANVLVLLQLVLVASSLKLLIVVFCAQYQEVAQLLIPYHNKAVQLWQTSGSAFVAGGHIFGRTFSAEHNNIAHDMVLLHLALASCLQSGIANCDLFSTIPTVDLLCALGVPTVMTLKPSAVMNSLRKLDDDDDDLPEALDTGRFPVSMTTRRILNFMKLLGQYLQLVRGPTWLSPSSVEADITGGSNMSSQVQPKQEASTASSKNYAFKKGDRVKYVVLYHQGFLLLKLRGKVVLAFEENGSSKIGVRFDRAIPEGNDLGGLCEEDHVFFCAADLLRLDSSALMTLKSSPLMNSSRHRECLVGNPEAYAAFKIKLETLPENVVVIASHTQTDSRKEKSHPGGLLFTKFGSNQTALLDLAFPLHDRSKETPKTMKQLSRLFQTKLTIQIPQDEAVLVDWKQKLDRDTETLKSQSNIGSIRSVLKRLLAGVYAITLCLPPEHHPRSGNTLFEVKVNLCRNSLGNNKRQRAETTKDERMTSSNSNNDIETLAINGLFEERSDLPLESPEPVEFFSINHCFFPSSALKLDDDDDLPGALVTGRFPVSVTTRYLLVSAIGERPHLAFLDHSGRITRGLEKKLDRNAGTVKSQSHIGSMCSVLKRLLAEVYAITLCIPPELHPRSGNTLFEVKIIGIAKHKYDLKVHSMFEFPDWFQERSDLPLESPEPIKGRERRVQMVLKRNKSSFGCRKLDDDDDLPEALDTGRFPVSVTTRYLLVSAIDESPLLAFLDHSGRKEVQVKGKDEIILVCFPGPTLTNSAFQ